MLRDLFDVGTKLKENIFKSNNQISSTVVTRTWFCQQNGPERGQVLVCKQKNGGVPVCLKGRCCFSGCVDIVSN